MVARALREWLAQLGTKTLYIEPGSPWENGYCESFNGKLRDECLRLEIFYSLKEAQVVIGAWRDHYNRVLPHSSLGYRPPAPVTLEAVTQQLPTPTIMQQALNVPGSKSRSGHPGLNVVHACWHPAMQERLRPHPIDGALPRERLTDLSRKGTDTEEALEAVLKGVEEKLPEQISFRDKYGDQRREVRVRWWLEPGTPLRAAALIEEAKRDQLPETPLPPGALLGSSPDKPCFFGHYWMKGEPVLMSPKAVCVDWSVAAGGALVAYRFDGEPTGSLLPTNR